MKRQPAFVPAATFAIVLAACSEPDRTPTAPIAETSSPSPDSSPSYSATPAPGEELPPSQTTPGPIPLDFRHVWAIEAADCRAAPGLTRIAIAPGAIKFYEGRSEVVSADAPHDGALVLQIAHTAEGQTSNETHTLALDDAKTTLTYQRDGNIFTYRRCD
jgi:hypothetical protein